MNKKSLKYNAFMNIILTVTNVLFPLIIFPYVSRVLLPSGMGKISFATSFVNYFIMLAQLGIPLYGIRECAKYRNNKKELSKVFQELFIISFFMMIISCIMMVSLVYTIPSFEKEKMIIFIIAIKIIFDTIGVNWLYTALEKFSFITFWSLLFKIISLFAIFILIKQKQDVYIYAGLSIFAVSASNLVNFIYAHNFVDFKVSEKHNFKRHLKPIFVLFAMTCAGTVYTNLDNIMLGIIKSDIDVGYYNVAVKIKIILVSIVTSIATVVMPRASYYLDNGLREEFLRITDKTRSFIVFLSVPMIIFFCFFAYESIITLSGSDYIPAIPSMIVITPTILFIGLTHVYGIEMLIPIGKEKYILIAQILGAFIDLIINLLLIPRVGAVGAAIGTLVAEFIVFLIEGYCVVKLFKIKMNIKSFIRHLIIASVAMCFTFNIKFYEIGIFIKICISSTVFFLIYFVIEILIKDIIATELLYHLKQIVYRKKRK